MLERMSDAEARHLLEFAQHFQHRRDDSLTLKRLATNLVFKVPRSGARVFQVVAPIHVFHPCGESCNVCFGGIAMSHDISLLPLPVLRENGFAVLVRELGPANALRFLHLYQPGTGNYTAEREQWLGSLTLEEIDAEIKRLKLKGDI